ncbi:MAG: putative toxin-antitoxin system toxin component, PIN family [Deltaproteobacteria bacterium]|jgi:uncharacterized protein|nr:putative toxin-antitoxin system toxin component, PIN family [Deltaproteobacteria bacterium]MBT6500459.1 putative toxin-antitoxin system toxin component, PIN family [Deltaproteobacteria bacterium]
MNIVFDSNIYIAAFATHGVCHLMLESCITEHNVFISDFILGEIKEKLIKKIKLPPETVDEIISYLGEQAIVTNPKNLVSDICRDPDDDNIISLGLAAKAEYIVTGDRDLLDIGQYASLHMVSPKEFSEVLKNQRI